MAFTVSEHVCCVNSLPAEGRPLVTFTATGARRAPATGTAAATATATASGPALSSVAASTVPRRATVQRMVPPQVGITSVLEDGCLIS